MKRFIAKTPKPILRIDGIPDYVSETANGVFKFFSQDANYRYAVCHDGTMKWTSQHLYEHFSNKGVIV